jgi:hypothetical protein
LSIGFDLDGFKQVRTIIGSGPVRFARKNELSWVYLILGLNGLIGFTQQQPAPCCPCSCRSNPHRPAENAPAERTSTRRRREPAPSSPPPQPAMSHEPSNDDGILFRGSRQWRIWRRGRPGLMATVATASWRRSWPEGMGSTSLAGGAAASRRYLALSLVLLMLFALDLHINLVAHEPVKVWVLR